MKFLIIISLVTLSFSCRKITSGSKSTTQKLPTESTVGSTLSKAVSHDELFISWKENLVDDISISGADLSGSDGLEMADLDGDGYEDVVSVHESDTEYDGALKGNIRIAFGSAPPP
ncbi:MAG: hypothetical protein ACJA01_000747 [Saprospiraceae bacterium]|jgi:hypothetical protein